MNNFEGRLTPELARRLSDIALVQDFAAWTIKRSALEQLPPLRSYHCVETRNTVDVLERELLRRLRATA